MLDAWMLFEGGWWQAGYVTAAVIVALAAFGAAVGHGRR